MKSMVSEKALRYSEEFIRILWTRDADSCRDYLHRSFTYIGPSADEYCLTPQTLPTHLVTSAAPLDATISEAYFQVRFEHGHLVVLTGTVLAYAVRNASEVASCRFRVSLVWVTEEGEPKLLHLHISTPSWETQPLGALAGESSDSSVIRMLAHARNSAQPLAMRDSAGVLHFLDACSIIYLEAERQYTMVHTTEGVFRLARVLGKVAAGLPPQFLRVHRGFVVNVVHVREIRTRTLLLDEGTEIPMPERRSVQLRKDVERAIRSLPARRA